MFWRDISCTIFIAPRRSLEYITYNPLRPPWGDYVTFYLPSHMRSTGPIYFPKLLMGFFKNTIPLKIWIYLNISKSSSLESYNDKHPINQLCNTKTKTFKWACIYNAPPPTRWFTSGWKALNCTENSICFWLGFKPTISSDTLNKRSDASNRWATGSPLNNCCLIYSICVVT